MPKEQIAMGLGVVGLSLLGLYHSKWLLSRTRKGQWLSRSLGPERGLWTLRALLGMAILFGFALASGWINPIEWE